MASGKSSFFAKILTSLVIGYFAAATCLYFLQELLIFPVLTAQLFGVSFEKPALPHISTTKWNHIQRETNVSPENVIVLGNSLGSGIASHLAKTIQPKALILIAPYASIPAVVRSRMVYRPFEWVLRYNLSVIDDLRALTRGEVIVAHGKADGVIPFDNFTQIIETLSHNREVEVTPLVSETAGHNEIYYAVEDELVSALKKASGLLLYPTP